MSKALLIASYYRSGTSALSGTLNLAGVDIVNSDEHNEHNPRGYFENPVLIKRDLEVLRRLGREWHDVRPMPDQWWQRPDVGADTQFLVGELKSHHADSVLWAVKHPHLCRLLPIYEDAARRVSGHAPGVVQIYRDPWVVAHSQFKKNGLSRAHALLLWLSHVLDAERYSRELDRVTLDYELLVKDSSQALRRISTRLDIEFPNRSAQDLRNISQFLTPSLRRSTDRGRDSTPRMLRDLVEDVWNAALEDAGAERFDQLRARFDEQCALLDDLAASQLPVTAALGGPSVASQSAGEQDDGKTHAEGSPLRPSERTDVAEKQRLESAFADLDAVPTIGVVVAVPPGRIEAAFRTEASIAEQWHAPNVVRYVTSDPDAPQRQDWHAVDTVRQTLTAALGVHMAELPCDYVAIIDAGDRIEPDACLRMCLFAEKEGRPTLLYTDEIVANARDPWIRYKSDFDIERLRGLHYIGSWLWCRRDFLVDHGTLEATLAGAEDLDLALRVHDAGGTISHLPEAQYARAPDSLRDPVDTDTLRAHVRAALDAHLHRHGRDGLVHWHDGTVPGSVVPRYRAASDRALSMILLCNSDDARHADDLEPERLAGVIQALSIEHLICAGTSAGMAPEIAAAMQRLRADNPAPDTLHVIEADSEGAVLREVASVVGDEVVVFLELDAHTSDPTWLAHLQGRLEDPSDRVGMIGARAEYPDPDVDSRMAGPLLLGGDDGVGVVGLGRTAGDPGPGGWLLGPQSVDGVAPPCVALRGELLRSAKIDAHLDGALLWLDLSMQIWDEGFSVVWDPSVSVQCPRVPSYATQGGHDFAAGCERLRGRWGCASRHHHPMLALKGDILSQVNPGLAPPAPGGVPYALLSGAIEGAELAVEWLRAGRMSGELIAGWAPEPIPITELRRLAPQAWLRVNPDCLVSEPDAPAWRALYSRVPKDGTPLKEMGTQAEQVYATSPVLADVLRKRSYNRMKPEFVLPRLSSRLWSEIADLERVGRNRPRVLWVDEGDAPDWITDLLSIGGIDWFVVEGGDRRYDGPIATRPLPTDEMGWRDLFLEATPNLVIRPTREATWMDCQLLLRGAASGAALVADARLHCPAELPVMSLGSRFDDWRQALNRLTSDTEALMAAGRNTRNALEQIGWVEDSSPQSFLLDTALASAEAVARRAG